MQTRKLTGNPFPLGATWDGKGVNFAVFSETAEKVDLCLFDANEPKTQKEIIPLEEITGYVWHCYLPGIKPGQPYGYRIHGPYKPEEGLRFNNSKLLIDPYAKAIQGGVDWKAPVFGYGIGDSKADLSFDPTDDAWGVPKGVVIDPSFEWDGDEPPCIPWNQTIIYETHVKGFTARHPGVSPKQRGTYAGLASKSAREYFKNLGITSVELLPVHDFLDDKALIERKLRNYWGYNTTNFFAPSARYSSSGDTGGQVTEFKQMVKSLHKDGIEVILDVVYNHTSEGNHLGPTLSFKGIDNPAYYRLTENRRYYMDYTATGNSPNMRHPEVLKLIMDSLRYWILEMHIDGFRFDLAATLARELFDVDRLSAFFDIIHQDPVISRVKLIAEPWDVGNGGYQVGNFPVLWTEWNGKYRDSIRRFWRGDQGEVSEFAYRFSGSSDLYEWSGRKPYASINYVTAHDGFTLHDLVSYNQKHNEANGENNKDGDENNLSWNCGVEGPSDSPDVISLRNQQKRNFLATLLLSQGVPMLSGGDEIGRTQLGNNNAYCQDNEISWYDWQLDDEKKQLLVFVKQLIKLRRQHPALHRRKFFHGRPIRGTDIKDIVWLRPDGKEMSDEDWKASWIRCVGVFLSRASPVNGTRRAILDSFIILLNSHNQPIRFKIPSMQNTWRVVVNTSAPDLKEGIELNSGDDTDVPGRAVVVLQCIASNHRNS